MTNALEIAALPIPNQLSLTFGGGLPRPLETAGRHTSVGAVPFALYEKPSPRATSDHSFDQSLATHSPSMRKGIGCRIGGEFRRSGFEKGERARCPGRLAIGCHLGR